MNDIKDISIDDERYKKFEKVWKYALDMTEKECKQSAEGLLHNLNSLQSRSGNQLPFSSINYGTCTLSEGRMFTRAILETSIKGVGNGATSIFPCQIFQKMKGVNDKGSPNYDLYQLAIESTSKRLYPNYCNVDWSNDAGYNDYEFKKKFLDKLTSGQKERLLSALQKEPILKEHLGITEQLQPVEFDPRTIPSTMGCRTYSSKDCNWEDMWTKVVLSLADGRKIGKTCPMSSSHMKDGRGNIAPATIVLPTLAMEAKKKSKENPAYVVDYFMDILKDAIEDTKDELIERYNWICAQNPASATFMYENKTFYYYEDDFNTEGIRGALKHGSLAIGQLGLAEALNILVGINQISSKGMEVAKQIEQLFKDKCAEYKQNYKLNFGVYFTPAEGLCHTAMKKFTKKYGLIEGVNAYKDENGKLVGRDYFTNSIHVPVWEEIDPFEKIDIESQLTGYSQAGCITYIEVGDNAANNLGALEQLVDYAMKKDIPYFAINLPISHCKKCGSNENIAFDSPCPICGADESLVEHLARVTGYLSTDYRHFNKGKQMEAKMRYVHVNKLSSWNKKSI